MERKLIADFVKENLAEERTGHDYYHGKRVAVLAERMLLADHPEAGQKSRDIAYTAALSTTRSMRRFAQTQVKF